MCRPTKQTNTFLSQQWKIFVQFTVPEELHSKLEIGNLGLFTGWNCFLETITSKVTFEEMTVVFSVGQNDTA